MAKDEVNTSKRGDKSDGRSKEEVGPNNATKRASPSVRNRRRVERKASAKRQPVKSRSNRFNSEVDRVMQLNEEHSRSRKKISTDMKKRCKSLGIRLTEGTASRKKKPQSQLLRECEEAERTKKENRRQGSRKVHFMRQRSESQEKPLVKSTTRRRSVKKKSTKTNDWTQSISQARKELGVFGFQSLTKDSQLYLRAKEILQKKKEGH